MGEEHQLQKRVAESSETSEDSEDCNFNSFDAEGADARERSELLQQRGWARGGAVLPAGGFLRGEFRLPGINKLRTASSAGIQV